MTRRVVVAGVVTGVVVVAGTIGAGLAASGGPAHASRDERVAAAERTVWDRYATPADAGGTASDEAQALADMIAHHDDAIDGASRFLANADPDSPVARFAERIVRVQTAQVATMTRWLAAWYPDAHPSPDWMPMFADPAATASAGGFLRVMIAHHEHAIAMYSSWVAAGIVQHDDLGILAARIAKGQEGEIARMRQLASSPA